MFQYTNRLYHAYHNEAQTAKICSNISQKINSENFLKERNDFTWYYDHETQKTILVAIYYLQE